MSPSTSVDQQRTTDDVATSTASHQPVPTPPQVPIARALVPAMGEE